MTYQRLRIDSPIGGLVLIGSGEHLHGVLFEKLWSRFSKKFSDVRDEETPVLREAAKQLNAYFDGKRRTFDLPLKLTGTAFQNKVWEALGKIPFGNTSTYKQQAVAVKSPNAVRAVGQTNGRNPLCIVLPCHRVIGSDGSATGYAGGVKAKEFLLNLEGIRLI